MLARAYTRVIPTSYSSTLNGAYEASVPLLWQALEALRESTTLPLEELGTNHTLPSNGSVMYSLFRMMSARTERIIYGAFREKRWRVGSLSDRVAPEVSKSIEVSDLESISVPKGYTFIADPAGFGHGRLYCEAMNAKTGKGQIAACSGGEWKFVDIPVNGGHRSYPQVFEHEGMTYLFPEIAKVDTPTLFSLDHSGLICRPVGRLIGLENQRIIDGTLLSYAGHWYLFAGKPISSRRELHLWVADKLMGPYHKHPKSSVCLDPRSARMAGPILHATGALYRPGQDSSVSYGRGITISRIESLTPTDYSETVVSRLTMQGAFGPHTILSHNQGCWLDYYTETWSALAGVRRLRARL